MCVALLPLIVGCRQQRWPARRAAHALALALSDDLSLAVAHPLTDTLADGHSYFRAHTESTGGRGLGALRGGQQHVWGGHGNASLR